MRPSSGGLPEIRVTASIVEFGTNESGDGAELLTGTGDCDAKGSPG